MGQEVSGPISYATASGIDRVDVNGGVLVRPNAAFFLTRPDNFRLSRTTDRLT